MKNESDEKGNQSIDLVDLAVVLRVRSNDPSLLNPDFLLYNNIVDSSWSILKPQTVSTPAYSQVTFDNGVTIRSDPERIIFQQTITRVDRLEAKNIVCPGMAKRYVQKMTHYFTGVGINPKGYMPLPPSSEPGHGVADALLGAITWMSFKHTIPEARVKLIYGYNRRTIFLDITEATKGKGKPGQGSEDPGLLFSANIHRDLGQKTPEGRIERLVSIFDSWENDVSEFYELVNTLLTGRT